MPFRTVVNARGISFAVKVVTGASKSVIVGPEEEYLKIRLAAPAVNGKANRALIELLSEVLGVPKSSVQIRTGLASKRKLVQVEHSNAIALQRVLVGFSNLS
jgi:uncharacterized protein